MEIKLWDNKTMYNKELKHFYFILMRIARLPNVKPRVCL